MDVHKDSIQIAVAKGGTPGSEKETRVPYDFARLWKFFHSRQKKGTAFVTY